MLIAIISDTHDSHHGVKAAVKICTEHRPQYILHAGDITSDWTIFQLSQIPDAKLIAVLGNCDNDPQPIIDAVQSLGGEIHQPPWKGEIAGKNFYMTHKPDHIEYVAESKNYNIVIYGHTHQQDIRQIGQTLLINPGLARSGFGSPGSMVLLETESMTVQNFSLK